MLYNRINVLLTSTFFLYRGLVHHRVLNKSEEDTKYCIYINIKYKIQIYHTGCPKKTEKTIFNRGVIKNLYLSGIFIFDQSVPQIASSIKIFDPSGHKFQHFLIVFFCHPECKLETNGTNIGSLPCSNLFLNKKLGYLSHSFLIKF